MYKMKCLYFFFYHSSHIPYHWITSNVTQNHHSLIVFTVINKLIEFIPLRLRNKKHRIFSPTQLHILKRKLHVSDYVMHQQPDDALCNLKYVAFFKGIVSCVGLKIRRCLNCHFSAKSPVCFYRIRLSPGIPFPHICNHKRLQLCLQF
jgi:hypothetical protein